MARRTTADQLAAQPPVLANSFPKSGTHLLVQIVEGLPDRTNYGTFLASNTSSFQLRERSPENTCGFIRGFVPGEIVRGHLYYDPAYAEELNRRRTVNYFVYRDPRDVVVSEATHRQVSTHLARRKDGRDLDDFVEHAVRVELGLEAPRSSEKSKEEQ